MLSLLAGLAPEQRAEIMKKAQEIRAKKSTPPKPAPKPANQWEAIMSEPVVKETKSAGWTDKASIILMKYGAQEGDFVVAYRQRRYGMMSYKPLDVDMARRYRQTGAADYVLALGVWDGHNVVTEGFQQFASRADVLAALNAKLAAKGAVLAR
jgi:hypothetical protein